MSGFDDDFRTELKEPIHLGEIVLLPNGEHYDRLLSARYPSAPSQIAWNKIPADQRDERHAGRGNEASAIAEFFETVVRPRTKCTDADRVVFIGDAMDDTTLEMSIATLLKYRSILFSYPQHHFVFPPDGAWCFSYSFEDDMYFGFAPR